MTPTTTPTATPAGDELSIEIVTVTPDLARGWLRENTHNRSLRERTVIDYARDMAAGHWALNGEAVKRAADGTLLDGQHRLAAVVRANVPVPMLVINGLPLAAQDTMDTGRRRTAGDVFNLHGETNATTLAAVLRKIWLWDAGDRRFHSNPIPTTAELAELLERRPEIRRSADMGERTYKSFRYLSKSVLGTAHHLFLRVSPDDVPWFFQRVADGANLPLGDPILTLRNRAMSDRAAHTRSDDARAIAYMVRAWNAYRDGRTLSVIQHPAGTPCPDPK